MSKLKEVVGYHEKVVLPDALKKVHKVVPVSGTSLTNSGETVTTIDLPKIGVMDGKFATIQFDCTVTAAANNGRLSKGNAGMIWDKVRVLVGDKLVQEYRKFGLLSVQKMKQEKPADWYGGLGSVIAYEASETNQSGTQYRYMMTFPDGCFLNDMLPLGSMPQIRIELHLDSNTNNYTTCDNGLTDARTIAVTNISFQAPIIETASRGKTYSGHYVGYAHKLESIASGTSSQEFNIPISNKLVSGVEMYLLADADTVNHDNFNKVWSTKYGQTSGVEVYLNGDSLGSKRPILGDEAVELVYHTLIYNGYCLNDIGNGRVFQLGSEAWTSEAGEDTAGDFYIAVNFGALDPSKGVSGVANANSTLEVKWAADSDGIDEATTAHIYVRYHGKWDVDAAGNFTFRA